MKFIFAFLRVYVYKFLIIIFLIIIVFSAVIGFFDSIVSNVTAFFNPTQQSQEYLLTLDDEEREKLEKQGLPFPIEDIEGLLKNENKSYPRDTVADYPNWTEVHSSRQDAFLGIEDDRTEAETYLAHSDPEYDEITLDLEEITYPYRNFFQLQLSIATLYASMENDDLVLENIGEYVDEPGDGFGLRTVYEWPFEYEEYYDEFEYKYYDIDPETYEFYETVWDSTLTTEKTYKNGNLENTSETQIDKRTNYPLPLLKSLSTQFYDYEYEYDRIVVEEGEWVEGSTNIVEWTEIELENEYDDYGNIVGQVEIEVNYQKETTVYDRTRIERDTIKSFVEVENDNFFHFLSRFEMEDETTIEILKAMVKETPESTYITSLMESLGAFDAENLQQYIDYDYEITPGEFTGTIPLMIQTDSRWAALPYGSQGTIGGSGCGPTSMAMVINAFNVGSQLNISGIDQNNDGIVDPYEMGVWSVANGHRVYGAGSAWSLFAGAGNTVGLRVRQVGVNQGQQVINALSNGDLVIASMGPGEFTRGGHFIVLRGIDSNGKILVNDSNSVARSNASYNFGHPIVSQAKQFFIVENPN